MSWGVSLVGLGSTLRVLNSLRTQYDDDAVYLVGPAVEYAVYVDQGTSKMEARPFVRPAAERVNRNLAAEIGPLLDGGLLDASEDDVVRAAALAVQREMQRIITAKGAVDTGAMRASVSVEKIA